MGSWPSVCWCVFDCITDACFLLDLPASGDCCLFALRMVFLFLSCPLSPKKCAPKLGVTIQSAMVGDSWDLLAEDVLQIVEVGKRGNPDCIFTSNWRGFKAAFVLKTRNFSRHARVLCMHCCSALRHSFCLRLLWEGERPNERCYNISVLPLLSLLSEKHIFPADNGLICLVYVVLQLWYFAWRGKFKNLLNFFRHVPFWTLEALTTSSRWHDRCEWCFIVCLWCATQDLPCFVFLPGIK